MSSDPEEIGTFAIMLRRAAGHLIAGRDSAFEDAVEDLSGAIRAKKYKERNTMAKQQQQIELQDALVDQLVLVRTYSAGVHVGTLARRNGREVLLKDAYRLWSWSGAFTLSTVSQKGVAASSRIAGPVPEIVLTEAIEIMPVSDAARKSLTTATG